jgi:O-antigen/teichoic acid export membrane protein
LQAVAVAYDCRRRAPKRVRPVPHSPAEFLAVTEHEIDPPDRPQSVEIEPDPASLTEITVRGAGLAGAGHILSQVLTLGFYVVLARLATPHDFGAFTAGSLLVSLGMLFTESGMMAALIHRADRIDEAASTAVVAAAAGGLALTVLALAAAPIVGLIFDSSTVAELAAVSSGLLLLRSLLVVPEALFQRRFSFLRRVVIEPFGVLVFGAAAIIATANGLGAWGILIGYYAGAAGDVLLSWALLDWRPRRRQVSFQVWRELIAYGRHILTGAAVWRAGDQVPVVLIGRFAGAASLGQFRYCNRIISTPFSLIVQAGSYVLFPALARISASRDRLRAACRRSLRLMCAFAFPLTLLLVPLAVPLAVIVFGGVWRDAGYAAMAMAGWPVAGTLVSFTSEVVKADGHPEILPRMHAVTLIAGTISMLALLPLDLIGVVVGYSIGWLAGGAYGLRRTAQLLEMPLIEMWREVMPPAFAAMLMAGLLTPLEFLLVQADTHGTAIGLALLAAEGLLGAAIYLAALRVLARGTLRELREVTASMLRAGRSLNGEAETAEGVSVAGG